MTAPDAPREAEVRAWLKSHALFDTPEAVAALALLDAGRKDRERVDWLAGACVRNRIVLDGGQANGRVAVWVNGSRKRTWEHSLRAAIDRARVEAIRLPDYSHRVENLAQESR